jgi:hypothetical protein
MPVFTVHEPPLRKNESEPDPMRFVFVRDGFYFWAFLFGPLWLLRRRLWLAFIFYFVVAVLIGVALSVIGASQGAQALVVFLFMVLLGLEAATLRRWTLQRRGFTPHGVVIGEDLEMAEQRFFDGWQTLPSRAAPEPVSTSFLPTGQAAADIIGLFPRPGPQS